jgi:phosphoribosylformylglycinamidine synthase
MGNESQKTFHQPDGRILGKVAHSDRISAHVLQNIPGDIDQKLFASGVRYFQ